MRRSGVSRSPFADFWQRFLPAFATRKSRSRPQSRAALQIETLEMRRAMYGANVLDLGEGEVGSFVDDFSLTDVNPNSVTFNQPVSPRDFLQHASAWYFGHST